MIPADYVVVAAFVVESVVLVRLLDRCHMLSLSVLTAVVDLGVVEDFCNSKSDILLPYITSA